MFRTAAAACLLAAAFALLAAAAPARAQTPSVLVSTLGQTHFSELSIFHSLGAARAQSFTTGGNAGGYTLTGADVDLASSSGTSVYTVTIRSDSSGVPGGIVGTLTNPASLPQFVLQTGSTGFTAPGGGIDLAPGRTYWVTVQHSSGGSLAVSRTSSASPVQDAGAAPGWSIGSPGEFRNGTWTVGSGAVGILRIAVRGYAKAAPPGAASRGALKRGLAAVASRTVSGALDNIGTRLGEAVPASGLNLGGLNLAGPNPAGRQDAAGFDGHGPSGGSRGMTPDDLLGSGAFSLALGAAEGDKDADPMAPRWSVWGRGDFGTFAGRPDGGSRYDGDLRTGWLGADARGTRGTGRWVAGLAVSRGTSGTDYGSGRLETDLTALWPYGRWTFPDGLELRGLLGAGRGEARHRTADGEPEKSGLTMWAASAGFSRPLPPLGGFDFSARGDASVAFMETATGLGEEEAAVDGLEAAVSRVRGGVEASRRIAMADGAAITPFAELAGRMDGGDGVTGPGVELAGGLRYAGARVAVEARGRWLAAHSEAGAKERGASLTVRLDPGALGRGLSLSLAPRWGAPAGGADKLWRDEIPKGAAAAREAGGFEGELGYGFSLLGGRLTGTPNFGLGVSEDARDYRIGWRLTPAVGGYAGFEVSLDATRRESANPNESPGHGAMLTGAFRW